MKNVWLLVVTITILLLARSATSDESSPPSSNYGADISWPMQHSRVSTNYPWLPHNVDPENNPIPEENKGMPLQPLGNRQQVYDDYIRGCQNSTGPELAHLCIQNEEERVNKGSYQPSRMKNYTEIGFKKMRAPESVFKLIKDFWEANNDSEKVEDFDVGYTITNHWDNPPTMVPVEDDVLVGGGFQFRDQIWNMANEVIQEWTGQKSFPTSVYGIRVYKEGAILATHIDRLPLVSSMIINVDQDVDEDWPLEVIGHDGIAYNVSMQPGDMVLYESHSILHGRPFALKGRYFANIFIHFAPVTSIDDGVASKFDDLSGVLAEEPLGDPSDAAVHGDLSTLKKIAEKQWSLLFQTDAHLWQPIHEAARAGHFHVVKYLVQEGADINALDHEKETPLDIAITFNGPDHSIVQKLKALGAVSGNSTDETDDEDDDNETTPFMGNVLSDAHSAASRGDLPSLRQIAEQNHSLLFQTDSFLWQPIHEAARSGHANVVQYLVQQGADVNALDHEKDTPLDIATEFNGEDHPIVQKLRDLGAVVGPLHEGGVDDNEEDDQEYSADDDDDAEEDTEEGEFDAEKFVQMNIQLSVMKKLIDEYQLMFKRMLAEIHML